MGVLERMGKLRAIFLAGGMSEEEFEEARRRVILGQPVPWLEDDASAGEQGADADDTC